MLGGALGDALGEPVEFISSAHEILRRFGANAPAKLGYAHGPFITDDTQMTLFAAEGTSALILTDRSGMSAGASAGRGGSQAYTCPAPPTALLKIRVK